MRIRAETIFTVFIAVVIILLLASYFGQSSTLGKQTKSSVLGISKVSVIKVESIGFSTAELLVQFQINNPTPISAFLDNASYSLYGNGNYLGAGVITEQVKIPAYNSTYAESNFETGLVDSSRVIFSYIFSNNNQITWEAKGNATFSEPLLGSFKVHFDST
jgi:LEA14-like dessication related protein